MKAKMKRELFDYFMIALSLVIYTLGVVGFLVPANVVGGGVTGIGTLIYFFTNHSIPIAVPYLIINSVLIVIGVRMFGSSFGLKTVFAMGVTALALLMWQNIITEPLVNDAFMGVVIGGMCTGAGVGISISQGGSTGGTDIIALVVNRYWNIAPGRTILYLDVLIIGSSYFVFQSLSPVIYGFVAMAITAYFIDFVITGSKQSVQFFIFTDQYNEVANSISKEMHRGVSLINSYGWYSQKERKIVMVVVKKTETRQVFRIVKHIDSQAFISMNAVTGVYGQGFDAIR